MLNDTVTKLLREIAEREGYSKYTIETDKGSNHGDNYQGILFAVTIKGTTVKHGVSKEENLHLLCKMPSPNAMRRKNFKSALSFNRELSVYSKVLPHFLQFQKEKGLSDEESFMSYPKVYACKIDNENEDFVLIMEDLRPAKYEMWPGNKVMPLGHELLIMKELGKLHAVSFALKDQRPNEFEEYKELTDTFAEIFFYGKLDSFTKRSVEKAADVLDNPKHKKLMEQFRKTYAKNVGEFLQGESSKEFAVLSHGDMWNNNLLFKYSEDDKKQVKAVGIVDWQLSRYCPPVLDVLYNIFSATDKQFREQNYDKLLKTYYTSLSDTIRKLGSDPDKLYSWEDFQGQLRKFGEFSLLCGPFIIQLKMAGAEDVRDVDEYIELIDIGKEADLINLVKEESRAEYKRQVNDMVTDLIDYGYIKVQ